MTALESSTTAMAPQKRERAGNVNGKARVFTKFAIAAFSATRDSAIKAILKSWRNLGEYLEMGR